MTVLWRFLESWDWHDTVRSALETPMRESVLRGMANRTLLFLARFGPGATSVRVFLHRLRGVSIGKNVWIGYDAVIETSCPHLVTIRDGASIGIRATIIAHFRELRGVVIEEDASIGPGAIVLPNVTIGRGSIVAAGSVVTHSVPQMTLVQGNPAKPVASIGVLLRPNVSLREFSKRLRPIK